MTLSQKQRYKWTFAIESGSRRASALDSQSGSLRRSLALSVKMDPSMMLCNLVEKVGSRYPNSILIQSWTHVCNLQIDSIVSKKDRKTI